MPFKIRREVYRKVQEEMKAERGLTIGRMVELGGVSHAGFYRFGPDRRPLPDSDMDLRDAIQRIALEWPQYGRPKITAELRRRGCCGWPTSLTFDCRASAFI